MYGEVIYKIYLPDLGKLMHYVSADELRARRRPTKRDIMQERRDILLFKNARRQHALEELWVNGHPRLVPETREEYDRGRSRWRFGNQRNHAPQRASSAIRQNDLLVMAAPKNKQRASSLPPARYTWPKFLWEFASYLQDKPYNYEALASEEQDGNELKDPDDNEDYHESGMRAKAQFEVAKENGGMLVENVNDNAEHLNITEHEHEVQQTKRNRDIYYRQQRNHVNDSDLHEAPGGERVGKSNAANFSILVGDNKNGNRNRETPININFLFPKKSFDVVPQRWD